MGQLTPSFLFDLESRMRLASHSEYNRLLTRLWYQKIAKPMPSTGKRERVSFMFDTAKIDYVSRLGGEVMFEDLAMSSFEFEAKAATGGFKLNRFQLDDHDGGGVQLAKEWSTQIGAYAAYWPQKQVANALKVGGAASSLCYDGTPFFSAAHPVHPFEDAFGTYANDFTGAASGSYPGACPIDASVTLDVAFNNLNKIFTYVQQIKMPNGEDPRGLRVVGLIVPPAMRTRVVQLTNAKSIAQAAAGGGAAAADVEAVITDWGLQAPIVADELSAGLGGNDTTYYAIVDQLATSEVGAIGWSEREPFAVVYNGELTDAQLARMNELQWLTRGRNTTFYGHPYMLMRCRGA